MFSSDFIYEVGGNKSIINQDYSNYFSCFQTYKKDYIITDPFNSKIIQIKKSGEITEYINKNVKNWFPRWAIPYQDLIFYIDRNRPVIGIIKNGSFQEYFIPNMKNLVSLSLTFDNHILVCGRGDYALVELTLSLQEITRYFSGKTSFQSAHKINCNEFLITDIKNNEVYITDGNYNIKWKHGDRNSPGNGEQELLSPKYAFLHDNQVYIADGRNNRIKIIDLYTEKVKCLNYANNQKFWFPTCIALTDDKHLIVSDCYNCRIVAIDRNENVVWHFGNEKQLISYELENPRMLELVENTLWVVNAYSNKLCRININELSIENVFGGTRNNLFWPKGIRQVRDRLYIADSRNSRIVALDLQTYKPTEVINCFTYKESKINLIDPHDIDFLNEYIIVTDAKQNKVFFSNFNGDIVKILGTTSELKDPHQCRVYNDVLIVSDTGNNRIVFFDFNGNELYSISSLKHSSLNQPRWCEIIEDNNYLITDTGNNRVIIINKNLEILFEYGGTWGNKENQLRQPRCAKITNGKLYISDTENNRILIIDLEGKKNSYV